GARAPAGGDWPAARRVSSPISWRRAPRRWTLPNSASNGCIAAEHRIPMQRVLPPAASSSLPLCGAALTREMEQRAAATLPPHTLMRRAGSAVARLALAVVPHAQRIWVCAGPGNNGGDGLDAAIHLRAAGKNVTVRLLGEEARLPA